MDGLNGLTFNSKLIDLSCTQSVAPLVRRSGACNSSAD